MADCNHDHQEDRATSKRLLWALGVILTFMVVEIIGGLLSGSLALLADAAHMATDALALGLAVAAQRFAARPANLQLHFGYRRAQVLAAFANGVVMICLLFWILIEAVRRLFSPITVESGLMFWVAVAGLVANLVAFMLLHRPAERNLNARGALLHILGDLLGSVAAIVAAIVIGLTGLMWVDPLLSLIVVILIGFSAARLLKETSHILLEGAPKDLDIEALAKDVASVSEDIQDVHNVQVWQITPQHPRVNLHLSIDDAADITTAIEQTKAILKEKYGIRQSTIQVDIGGACPDGELDQKAIQSATISKHPKNREIVQPDTGATAMAATK